MLISLIIGAIIGAAIIAEIYFTISEATRARQIIKEKTKAENPQCESLVAAWVSMNDKLIDEETLVLRAYDGNGNHIANVNVTSPSQTGIMVGEKIYV